MSYALVINYYIFNGTLVVRFFGGNTINSKTSLDL